MCTLFALPKFNPKKIIRVGSLGFGDPGQTVTVGLYIPVFEFLQSVIKFKVNTKIIE